MKFGYYILNTYVPELDGGSREIYSKWLEQMDAAEALGFDSLWVTEHHFRHFGGQMPSPSVILAAAAQRTKKMRLGAAVSLLPMHNPLRIAEEFAMVDQLSEGRLCFGAGRGMHPDRIRGVRRRLEQRAETLARSSRYRHAGVERRRVRVAERALQVSQAQSLSAALSAAPSADLHHRQPRSGKFPSGRLARPPFDDACRGSPPTRSRGRGWNRTKRRCARRAMPSTIKMFSPCIPSMSATATNKPKPMSSTTGTAGAASPWTRPAPRPARRPMSACSLT